MWRGNLRIQARTRDMNKEDDMDKNEEKATGHKKMGLAMNKPAIVSPQEWEAARQQLLAKEKQLTRARDALAAERRRMPWLAVEKKYQFDGPQGKASLLDLFDGRRQLIVYRAFFEPGVHGWPDHACVGLLLVADHVGHLAHLNAPQQHSGVPARARHKRTSTGLKARMGWQMPWYTITDDFDSGLRRRRVARHERLHPRRRPHLSNLLHQRPRRRGAREHLELSRYDCPWAPREVGGLARGLPPDPALRLVEVAR